MNDKKRDPKEVTVTEPQLRIAVACVLGLLFFSVIVGYYWGKKRAYEEFLDTCYAESLSDKIAASLCSLYDDAEVELPEADEAEAPDTPLAGEEETASEDGGVSVEEGATPQRLEESMNYFAELAGFGALRTAKNYATRLKERGFDVVVFERISKQGKGKTRTWYQVVTKPQGYEALQAVVDKIKAEDRLQGITLVEYAKKHEEQFERAVA